jgi:hypothetical protein
MDVVEVPDRLEVTVVLEATIGADTAVARCNPKELAAMAGATEVFNAEVVMVAVEDSRPEVEVMMDMVADKLHPGLTHQLFHKEAGLVILPAHHKPKQKYQKSNRASKEEVMEEPGATVEEVMAPGLATASREAVMHHVELREVLREEVREEVDVLLGLTAVVIAVHIRTENMKKN